VDSSTCYALKDGVWFVGTSVNGPWVVATSVPQVIYTIPASSPLHYVTYVYVYDYTPQTVVVGYTPGCLGTVVPSADVVVYGTGYFYPPLCVGPYWYPWPVTYGFGAGFFWGGVRGFAFRAAAGPIWGGAWGHWRGYYGRDVAINNVHINDINRYDSWNRNVVNSRVRNTMASMSPQQRQQAQQRMQDLSATRPNNVFAGRDGNAYKLGSDGGWDRAGGLGGFHGGFGGFRR
jgi:hypothetical protein